MKNRFFLLLLNVLAFLPLAAHAGTSQFNVGVEGFYDKYRESSLDVTTQSGYGSILAGYVYNLPYVFGAIDGRFSYGEANYKSPDGHISGTPQYDGEVRVRGGLNIGNFSPYVGVGGRFFLDKGTGTETNLGYGGYDRHITQYYIPIGADWQFPLTNDGLTLTPNVEFDQLVYGKVKSDVAPFLGYDAENHQHSGYGLRASLMLGDKVTGTRNTSWQAGPFVRYWHITQSDTFTAPDGSFTGYEPNNTRLQVGGRLRFIFQ